jgi:dTDP-4-dehydrorhamnose reductase
MSLAKILLLGKNGQIGGDLQPLLAEFSEVLATERASLDLTRPEIIRECVRSFRPEVIINAAAYTAVDKAESEPALAAAINATAPGVLAEETMRIGALLIHYSTDYVFDGTKSDPYIESDPTHPLNVYGRTKLAGEEAIRASGCNHFIFRTSWIYSPRGSNFLLTILRLSREREELRIVDDQIGSPTSSASLARATLQVLRQWSLEDPRTAERKSGTYHLTASGHVSWFGFASAILERHKQHEKQRLRVRTMIPIATSEYPAAARRPRNSRLDCSKIADVFGVNMPHWTTQLATILKDVQLQGKVGAIPTQLQSTSS